MMTSHLPEPAAAAPTAESPFESWLRAHRRLTVAGLIVLALTLRIAVFVELAASPCFWFYEWEQTDMNYFHAWALAIMDGDRWSAHVDPPQHLWHRRVAERFAEHYPRRWAAIVAAHPDDPVAALWRQWCGGRGTYQDPLYPYLLAAVYAALGVAAGWIYALQNLIGVASGLLVYFITRRHFGDLAAVIAALLMLLYAPLLFYEFTLLRTTLITFFGLLIVLMFDRARRRERSLDWAAAGLIVGVAMMLKAHHVLMLPVGVGLALLGAPGKRRNRTKRAAVFALGCAVGFAPAVGRNIRVGAPPLRTASGGAVTFALSNAARSGHVGWDYDSAARVLGKTGGAFLPTVFQTLRTHPSPANYLRLLGIKVMAVMCTFEEPNNANVYYGQVYSSVLRRLPVTFGLVWALGALGMVLAVWQRARVGALLALVAANLAVLVGFMVLARFRLPLAAALLPFAGLTCAALIRAVCQRKWGRSAGIVMATGAGMLLTISVEAPGTTRVRPADVESGFRVYYAVKLRQAARYGDSAAAVAILRDALAHQPPVVRSLGPQRPPAGEAERQLAVFYAELYRLAADAAERAGCHDEAASDRKRAAELGGFPTTVPAAGRHGEPNRLRT